MRNSSALWFRGALKVLSLILLFIVVWDCVIFSLPELGLSFNPKLSRAVILAKVTPCFRDCAASRTRVSQIFNPRRRALLTTTKEKDEISTNSANVTDAARNFVQDASADSHVLTQSVDSYAAIPSSGDPGSCQKVRQHVGFKDACLFVHAHPQCQSGGVVDYVDLFFCKCQNTPLLGYALLVIWLAALFYMLGNTAADYFCYSLEKLSSLLHLPPTVAGVTLLPLGNGAPDVFASIAAFIGAGVGDVGLNSVLGAALFVTSVVAGSVCLLVAGTSPSLDRRSFIRDVCFFIGTLLVLFLILYRGEIYIWGALAFVSIYVIYAIIVAASEIYKKKPQKLQWHVLEPVIDTQHSSSLSSAFKESDEDGHYAYMMDNDSQYDPELPDISLPQWRWVTYNAIFSHQAAPEKADTSCGLWGWSESRETGYSYGMAILKRVIMYVEYPLILPRRLTIPIVEDDRWSKFFAVASVTLAPILLSWVGSTENNLSLKQSWCVYIVGASIGFLFGLLALFTTVKEHPPFRFLFAWVAGGFVMSVVWFYIIAKELVSVLVGIGIILEINPAILGLTVLAWGNSIGDLVANLALASNGDDSVQIALSGCYAGPMFNTLLGLGMSLVLACWNAYPVPFSIPKDGSLFYTLALAGLLWSLVMLPKQRMQPTKVLGIGLLTVYGLFLGSRIAHSLGVIRISD